MDPTVQQSTIPPCMDSSFTWLYRRLLERMIDWLETRDNDTQYALLFLIAYVFLLRLSLTSQFSCSNAMHRTIVHRLPSEALPITVGHGSGPNSLYMHEQEIGLDLQRRKNNMDSSTLVRKCWCSQSVVRSCSKYVCA